MYPERFSAMVHSFGEADAAGRDLLDSGLKSFASVSKGVQAIAVDATEYTRKSYEDCSTALRRLATAKSPEAVLQSS